MTRIIFYGMNEHEFVHYRPYEKLMDVEFRCTEKSLTDETAVFAYDCDAALVRARDKATPEAIDELVRCGVKILAMRGAGVDNIDCGYAKGRLAVVNSPAYSPESIAEYAFALLLSVIRHTHRAYSRTRNLDFRVEGMDGVTLHGKTLGIVGEGHIGKAVIRIAKGFGMKILVNTGHPGSDPEVTYVSKEQLFRESDFISLHCPYTAETEKLISRETIAMMKDGAVLINTARGGIVDTEALVEGLRSGKLGGVGLDVYEREKDIFNEDRSDTYLEDDTLVRLIAFPNVLVTSHQAFLTTEALDGIARDNMEAIRDFLETGTCTNRLA